MKKLIFLVLIVLAVLLAFNFMRSGELSLWPSSGGNDTEMGELNSLQGEFMAATREYRQAGRAAGMSGIDSSSQAAAALAAIDRVASRVEKIRESASSDSARKKADELLRKIRSYKKSVS